MQQWSHPPQHQRTRGCRPYQFTSSGDDDVAGAGVSTAAMVAIVHLSLWSRLHSANHGSKYRSPHHFSSPGMYALLSPSFCSIVLTCAMLFLQCCYCVGPKVNTAANVPNSFTTMPMHQRTKSVQQHLERDGGCTAQRWLLHVSCRRRPAILLHVAICLPRRQQICLLYTRIWHRPA